MLVVAALGRCGSGGLEESPGKIDFLFAECLNCEGLLCGMGSSTFVLRVLWCLPRVLMARSRKPMMVRPRGRYERRKEERLHKDAPGTDRHSRCFWSKVDVYEFRRLINPAVAFQAKCVALYRQ